MTLMESVTSARCREEYPSTSMRRMTMAELVVTLPVHGRRDESRLNEERALRNPPLYRRRPTDSEYHDLWGVEATQKVRFGSRAAILNQRHHETIAEMDSDLTGD